MMRMPPVPPFASPSAPTAAEIEAAFNGFLAYYRPFTIDGDAVAIRVEGSNTPSYTGSTQVRRLAIDGDTLRLGIPGQYQATLPRVR